MSLQFFTQASALGILSPIAAMFLDGSPGYWHDYSDLSTLFQDMEKTMPVTAVDQTVARVVDKSGNGNDWVQPTGTARAKLQQDASGRYYLQPDGADDCYSLGRNVVLSNGQQITLGMGVQKATADFSRCLLETSANSDNNNGSFLVFNGANLPFLVRGTRQSGGQFNYPVGVPSEYILVGDLAGTSQAGATQAEMNGQASAQVGTGGNAGGPGGGTFLSNPVNLFSRAGSQAYWDGRLYQDFCIGRTITTAERIALRTQLHNTTGAAY